MLWGGGGGQYEKPQLESKNHTTKQSSLQNQNAESLPLEPYDYSLSNITVLSHDKNPPSVEFVHFLDSDDLLTIDCIEKCLECIGDCDVVWHEMECLYEDGIKPKETGGLLESLGISEEEAKAKSFGASRLWERSRYFAWTPHGLFRASLLGDLRFCADIKAEDVPFGARLFVAANGIKIGGFVGYIYRIRANSVSDYTLNENLPDRKVAPFMQDMARCFSRSYELSTYYNSYSYAMLCLCIERLRRGLDTSKADLNGGLIGLIAKHIDHAFFGISFENDPRDVKGLLMELRPYIGLVKNKRIRRAYLYPKWARFLDLVRMPDVYWRRFRKRIKGGD